MKNENIGVRITSIIASCVLGVTALIGVYFGEQRLRNFWLGIAITIFIIMCITFLAKV